MPLQNQLIDENERLKALIAAIRDELDELISTIDDEVEIEDVE